MTAEATGMPPHHDPTFLESFFQGFKKSWFYYTTFVVLVMAVAGLIVAINGNAQIKAQQRALDAAVECQNRYNEVNNERTRLLTAVTNKERAAEAAADTALFDFTDALAKRKPTTEQAAKFAVLQDKLRLQEKARADGNREREENPVPPPPDAFCETK